MCSHYNYKYSNNNNYNMHVCKYNNSNNTVNFTTTMIYKILARMLLHAIISIVIELGSTSF